MRMVGVLFLLLAGLLLGRFLRGTTLGRRLCPSAFGQQALDQRSQMGDVTKGVMEKAGDQGGALGAAGKLGTSITDIQTHLDGLQKNVDSLKSIQKLLGG